MLDGKLYEFALSILSRTLNDKYVFHSINHTIDVISAVYKIFTFVNNLSKHQKRILLVAALLHDFGYIEGPDEHEKISIELAQRLLGDFDWKTEDITEVVALIESTHILHKPRNLLEKIIRDADVFHIGTDDYIKKSLLLRKELQNLGQHLPLSKWYKSEIDFLVTHSFELPQLKKERKVKKMETIKSLKAKLDLT